jgi:transposase
MMPAALSNDLRRRIVAAYQAGEGTLEEIAERFAVGTASVTRLLRLDRETGSIHPKTYTRTAEGRVRTQDIPQLQNWLTENPSLTQDDLAQRYEQETGRTVSQRTISRVLKKAGITRKKSRPTRRSATDRT